MSSAAQLIDELKGASRVLMTTHVRPDGDALGTTAAVQMALRGKGIESEILLLSKLPTKYAFLYYDNDIRFRAVEVEGQLPERAWFDRFDTLLVCDTGTWSQLPGLKEVVPTLSIRKLVLDHHQTQEDWADVRWVDTSSSAAGEMAATLVRSWGVPLSPAIAGVLFVAVATDTGWFQYSNTTPRTLRLAADLMDAGINTDRIYQDLFQSERVERLLLQQRAMASLRFHHDSRVATMIVRRDDFEQSRANVPDTENLVNIPLSVAIVEPLEPGPIRISFRSKGGLDVARFAEQFGGGGHARASGAKLTGSIDDVANRVVDALK
jgi:bifunctional oligoribonuclease and PAP phosphatase NrnA